MKAIHWITQNVKKAGVFLQEVRIELRKVVWPTRKQTATYTMVVLVAVLAVTIFLAITDAAFNVVIRRLLGI
ncbi:MAG: preprotein translocase subunit SecE [bacterium]|nr:preprotein translocase subunit SecE [bacterium]